MSRAVERPRPARGAVLESGVRFSDSKLWTLGERYYDEAGIAAWNRGVVPTYATTNACIAQALARLVAAHVRDLIAGAHGGLDRTRPVHVVELGAGSGRLGFLFLKKYEELTRGLALADVPVRYVMTDVTRTNLAYWRAHPSLEPLVAAGRLDFARLDAGKDRQLELEVSGDVLARATLANPLVVLATYVFCTMAHDAFRVEDGRLQEGLATLRSRRATERDPDDPALLERVELELDFRDAGARTYRRRELDGILEWYRAHLAPTCFTMPVGALRSIENLLRLSRDRLALVVADVGYSRPLELIGYPEIQLLRAGSPYLAVNLDAVGRFFEGRGGLALHTSPRECSLSISAFATAPPGELPETRAEFVDALDGFGPLDFCALGEGTATSPPDYRQALAMIRLSGHDPMTCHGLAGVLVAGADGYSGRQRDEVAAALEECWSNHYPIGDESAAKNVAAVFGWVYASIGRHADAVRLYERALADFGEEKTLAYNLELARAQIGGRSA